MPSGFDNIDVPEATSRGIPVGNTPDVLTHTTADATWALMMAAARRVTESERAVRAGQWRTWHPLHFLGQDIYGATLGVIGMGRIGIEVAKRARGFEMQVLYNDVYRREDLEAELGYRYVDQDTLLAESDFVTLHTVLNENTHHLIGEAELAMMKPTAVLVNASRGPVVDPKALYEALSNGVIGRGGAGRDRPGADTHRRPAADVGKLRHRAAHRQRQRQDARRDVPYRSAEPDQRPDGRAPADAGEPRGVLTASLAGC